MEAITCRLLPFACGDGPHNMAADEVLLQPAAAGRFSLCFYGWTQPTVSLGYFQPAACRLSEPQLAGLPYVRRPTGGATLVHHHELTYAIARPREDRFARTDTCEFCMHRIIAAALEQLGVHCRLADPPGDFRSLEDFGSPTRSSLCFHQFTRGDVLCGGAKIVGSAQRRHRHGLLEHGAVLLARSPFAPSLPGILELSGKRLDLEQVRQGVTDELLRQLGWRLVAEEWSDAEKEAIAELAASKYGAEGWNNKR